MGAPVAALTRPTPPRPAGDQKLADYVTELLAQAQLGETGNVSEILTEAVERELYGQAIRLANGDQTKAARWLGVSRPTMREKLTRYGLFPTRGGDTSLIPKQLPKPPRREARVGDFDL